MDATVGFGIFPKPMWRSIPETPYGILDFDEGNHYGSEELLTSLVRINPRLHLFGHIHRQHGVTTNGITTFSNGSILDSDYSNFRIPNIIDL